MNKNKPDVVNRINKINKTRVKKTACPEGQEVIVEAESPKDKDKQEEGKKRRFSGTKKTGYH